MHSGNVPGSTAAMRALRVNCAHLRPLRRGFFVLGLLASLHGSRLPRSRSISAATSCRSSRRTASRATGPTRRRARPTCGSTSRRALCRTKDPVIVPGKSSESELFHRVSSKDPDEVMPPPKSGKKLAPARSRSSRNGSTRGRSGRDTGPSSRSPGRPRRRFVTRRGSRTRSTDSCSRSLESKGLAPSRQRPTGPPCSDG